MHACGNLAACEFVGRRAEPCEPVAAPGGRVAVAVRNEGPEVVDGDRHAEGEDTAAHAVEQHVREVVRVGDRVAGLLERVGVAQQLAQPFGTERDVGGHTVEDTEPKFGLAVTGLVHPDRVVRNCTARPGDALVLTKALGTGVLATRLKAGKLDEKFYAPLVASILTSFASRPRRIRPDIIFMGKLT